MKEKIIFILILALSLGLCTLKRANAQFIDTNKPLFVTISTEWCFACKLLKPTLSALKEEYQNEVNFIDLDVTDEEALQRSEEIAKLLGIEEFFNSGRYAFPTVGIFCSAGATPDQVILGARNKESFEDILNKIVNESTYACNLTNTFKLANLGKGRPGEGSEVVFNSGRPDIPGFTDRPIDAFNNSGIPLQVRFWATGEVPSYNYFLILPVCSANNLILCSNELQTQDEKPKFKPWTPFATRDEKGFNEAKISKKG